MTLSDLAGDLPGARILGDAGVAVRAVRDDSRAVEAGDVFVAVRGRSVDGHDFAGAAVERGAVAVVVEEELDRARLGDAVQVVVPSGAEALGHLASRIAGDPGERMQLVGVTGTNGKTTTTFLVEAVLAAAGRSPGVVGTVSYRYGGQTHPAPYTTPTPLVLHRVLADMLAAGTRCAALEVSSAALAMDRLAGVRFRVGAFTNLTQDHLEVHDTMDAYREAKARLFRRHLAPDGVAVINADDPAAEAMIAAAGDRRVLRVSVRDPAAEVYVAEQSSTIAGIRAVIETPRGPIEVASEALLGHYNVANLALAVAIAEALGVDHRDVSRGIAEMRGVPGRVERVANGRGLDILVDYAHTPDALGNALAALRPLAARRLLCVFGCGGDRDPSKRPRMGAEVAAGADLAFVTSDNPRTEDPQAILDMILPGIPDPFFVHPDRRTAIRAAVAEAVPGDIVLIAGKGHEDYQILGTEKIHFDDREEAAAAAAVRADFPLDAVAAAAGARVVQRGAGAPFARVTIDGRAAERGDLYVAIRGERLDGHAFCAQAIERGAVGVLVEHGADHAVPAGEPVSVLEVADTREALGALARWHRRRWGKTRLVAVTGSAGKTTTKELIAAALGAAGPAHKSAGSFNNETGVPLSLLDLQPYHEAAVVEMGMRGLGQIAYLCGIAEPDVGVVVNAGVAHVGVVGSVEAIARGKGEIFEGLPEHGAAVLPAGDARLAQHAAGAPRQITFGDEDGADVRLVGYRGVGPDGATIEVEVEGEVHEVRIPLVGRHNAINAACAVAAAVAAGVDAAAAVAGLARARVPSMRSEVARVAGRHVLVDCYNANPASMRAALDTLAELRGDGRAVAVVGDMLELGDTAAGAHAEVGRHAAARDIAVIALGEHAAEVASSGAAEVAADPAAAAARALALTGEGDWILVKASRGMRLERVVDAMRAWETREQA